MDGFGSLSVTIQHQTSSRRAKVKAFVEQWDSMMKIYEDELYRLQTELVQMQEWVRATGARVAVVFEGRDAAGKGGTISRITPELKPGAGVALGGYTYTYTGGEAIEGPNYDGFRGHVLINHRGLRISSTRKIHR
mgnify:CR=1 FL=1